MPLNYQIGRDRLMTRIRIKKGLSFILFEWADALPSTFSFGSVISYVDADGVCEGTVGH